MKIIATSGIALAVQKELDIPDPIDIARGVEILNNAANTRPTTNDTKSN